MKLRSMKKCSEVKKMLQKRFNLQYDSNVDITSICLLIFAGILLVFNGVLIIIEYNLDK